ncbi:MAG: LysM peptidoglycan-binding domain-containing protein [Candidatus Eisenbacteria bacterium]|uniref:LysM peptidoglycan-binding domain-containing protein n=1 Tax=Eiseniibacteriota bacterium TaxID=2212470 RepID=A0A956M200_UNCEI|nr:LysM peptidoglycan-binding domain-containing protein [Candidatus Eisenbacteria bacterium]
MLKQNRVAKQQNYSFLRNGAQVRQFVDAGYLVKISGNRDYELSGVSHPYARPQVKTFIERLSKQYHDATGEKLVVTSLTRPLSQQPRNASDLSVHPTGMAIDFRIPPTRTARRWLENTFLSLESTGVIEATREHHPAHYHVAVFTESYELYVQKLKGDTPRKHRVADGDTLWSLARQYNTSVKEIKAANRLSSSSIYPGQTLTMP